MGTLRPLPDSFAAETPPSCDLGVLGPAARRSQAWFVFGESPFPRDWPALPSRPASRRWGPAHRRRVLSSHSRRAVHCSPLQLASAAPRLCSWVPLGFPPLSQQRVAAQRRASTRGTVPRATGGIGDRRAPRPGNQAGEPETRTSSPSRAVCHARTHVAASRRRGGLRQLQFTGSAALPWAVEGRRIGWAGAADTAARQVAARMHVGWRGGDHARASRA